MRSNIKCIGRTEHRPTVTAGFDEMEERLNRSIGSKPVPTAGRQRPDRNTPRPAAPRPVGEICKGRFIGLRGLPR